MDDTELQELSRKAAACLPADFWVSVQPDDVYWPWSASEVKPVFDGCWPCDDDRHDWTIWLHKSTEACTEIMVRVLWPADMDITGGIAPTGVWGAGWTGIKAGEFVYDADPMRAFCVAVLSALIALSPTQAEAK